ncbi:hypothetical protein FKM82_001630 [Ascaphus truei]
MNIETHCLPSDHTQYPVLIQICTENIFQCPSQHHTVFESIDYFAFPAYVPSLDKLHFALLKSLFSLYVDHFLSQEHRFSGNSFRFHIARLLFCKDSAHSLWCHLWKMYLPVVLRSVFYLHVHSLLLEAHTDPCLLETHTCFLL